MRIYLVGGALRDRLLGLPVHERDWVVVGADEQEMLDLGYRRADSVFPVFLHPQSGEEYALARRESKSGAGYKGFEVYVGADVTLEEDLARRDLTINAMAEDDQGNIIDPYHGREDLDAGLLRHVTAAFEEDPVRLLRVARFAAKLGQWGFRVAHATHTLMKRMSQGEDILALRPQRIWREMRRALAEPQPWRFFEVLHGCGALDRILPALSASLGEPVGHERDGQIAATYNEPLQPLKAITPQTGEPDARFVAACYRAALETGDPTLGLPLERGFRELMELTIRLGPQVSAAPEGGAAEILDLLEQARALQQPERFEQFLLICQALWPGQVLPVCDIYRDSIKAISEVSAKALQSQGYSGADLGRLIREKRLQSIRSLLSSASGHRS